MAAKRGGTRQAPSATSTVAEGAPASPAEDQDTLIPETVEETPVVAENATTPSPDDASADAQAPEPVQEDPAAGRLAALAALTGAPTAPEATPAAVPDVEATGAEATWADGDEPLITGVVAFSVYQHIVAGRTMQAYKGTTLHATEEVIARGERLGAIVRTV